MTSRHFLTEGTIVGERYVVRGCPNDEERIDRFFAYDPVTQHEVDLWIAPPYRGSSEEARGVRLCSEVVHVPKTSPYVVRYHDVVEGPAGAVFVSDHLEGKSLSAYVRQAEAAGEPTWSELHRIMKDAFRGLAAVHATGLVCANIQSRSILVTAGGAILVNYYPPASEHTRPLDELFEENRPYRSPERLRHGGMSHEDDVYALTLALWEMFTCRPSEPGSNPRSRPMSAQVRFDPRPRIPLDDLQQIFRALSEDPGMRPAARALGRGPSWPEPDPLVTQRPRIHPGPPPAKAQSGRGHEPALLVIHAPNAPESVGSVLPLRGDRLSIGRGEDQDLRLPDESVSMAHAALERQNEDWIVSDRGSANGVYSLASTDRASRVTVRHGEAVQLGECVLQLVSFPPDSLFHQRARRHLRKYDGLTGLLLQESMKRELEEDEAFAVWAEVPMHVARFRLLEPSGDRASRPARARQLALLRSTVSHVVHSLETLLGRLYPLPGAVTGPLAFSVSIVGPPLREVQSIAKEAAERARRSVVEGVPIEATIVAHDTSSQRR